MQSEDYHSAPGASTDTGVVHPANKRILVVEDDDIIRQVVATAVAYFGYEVDTAEDGQEGWEALNRQDYNLLITDNNMPRMTGLELVRHIRAANMPLPIIMASGGTAKVDRSLGITALIPKPFFTNQLLQTVREVLFTMEGEPGFTARPGALPANQRCANQI